MTYGPGAAREGEGVDGFTFTVTDRGDPDTDPGDGPKTGDPAAVAITITKAEADRAEDGGTTDNILDETFITDETLDVRSTASGEE